MTRTNPAKAYIIRVLARFLFALSSSEVMCSTPASMINKAAMPAELYRMSEYNIQDTSLIWFSMGVAGSIAGTVGGEFWAEARIASRHTVKTQQAKRGLILLQ